MWRVAAVLVTLAAPTSAETITGAQYTDPTGRYPHGVLGDAIEYGTLEILTDAARAVRIVLPDTRVFEDTEPRLADLDGDGAPEVIVAESDARLGARLAVYGVDGLIAAGPFIGTAFRWLAIAGAADLDGDGAMEIAYVDRPHLAKTLRVFRFIDGSLTELASLPGVTNHRIGERDIAGGIRDCGAGPEVIVADAGWRVLLAVTLTQSGLAAREVGTHEGRASFAQALRCEGS
ncbi:MAG: VCBS repeat-containing protein [Pseudomonadota bacterium]